MNIITLALTLALSACGTRSNTSQVFFDSEGNEINKRTEAPWGEDYFFKNREPSSSETPEETDSHPGFIYYTVKKHDTLMLISQSTYGDYSRWREILENNPVRARHLVIGEVIKLVKPLNQDIESGPKGLPYIIQRGDTLASISDDKYGTPKKWVKIYKNNITLIKDPNRIFAGFTIFYEPEPNLSYQM